MEYLLSSPDEFHEFVEGISKEDKVGIVTHTDVDGLISGVFLKKILESKNIEINFMEFLNYGFDALKQVEGKDFDKIFFTDWNVDNYPEDLDLLRKKGEVLVFDHHPLNENIENKKGIIKTESKYCSSHALFDLAKNYFDTKSLEKLVCSAIILDYTFTEDENFNFLKSIYPEVKKEKIFESEPGKLGKIIDNAIIYYKPEHKKSFDLILKEDWNSMKEKSEKVEKELSLSEKKYLQEAEYYSDKNLYFDYIKPSFSFTSAIVSKVSHENPKGIFLIASDILDKESYVKVSSRAQSGKFDLGKILKKVTKDFENASAGGHEKAASASFPKRYLGEFKEKILREL
jgi:single-stranded DNA-specific DHH superfamily exonuclease